MSTARDRGEHGVTAYRCGCHCPRCRRALRTRSKVWNATRTAMRWAEPATIVSTARARAHVVALLDAGWSQGRIARTAGVSRATVQRVLVEPNCSRITARLVMAVS